MSNDGQIMRPFGRKAHDFIMREPLQDKRYTLLVGSVRSSKTFTLTAKTIVQLSRYEALPANAKRLMTGATKQTLYRNVLIDLFNIVGRDAYSYNTQTGELWLFGKQWFCLGAKDDASYRQILGMTVGLTVGDEVVEYPKTFMAQLFLRMSPEHARLYGSTNPSNPYCYLKSEVIDNPKFAHNLDVINFSLEHDNPNIEQQAKADIIASQTGVYRERYILGRWVVAEGSVFRDAWDEVENQFDGTVTVEGVIVVLQPEPVGLRAAGGHVDHWFSVDPGVDHVQAHLEYYDDGDIVWVTREQRWDSRKQMKMKSDGQYVDDLIAFGAERHQIIVPPEAASLKAELINRGLWVTEADNAVSQGIHTLSTMFTRRKLRVSRRGCPELCKRIPTYSWNPNAAKSGKEEPLKVEDDDVDSLRYGIHGKVPQWRVTNS